MTETLSQRNYMFEIYIISLFSWDGRLRSSGRVWIAEGLAETIVLGPCKV